MSSDDQLISEPSPQFNLAYFTNETTAERVRRFIQALVETGKVYRDPENNFVFIDSRGPRTIAVIYDFVGLIGNCITVGTMNGHGTNQRLTPRDFKPSDATPFFNCSDEARLPLPPINGILRDAVVVPDGKGGYRALTDRGLDKETGLYLCPSMWGLEPRNSTEHLEKCFANIPFCPPEYFNNLLGFMLGAISAEPFMERPLLVVDGNTQGVGKTSTLRAVVTILTGEDMRSISWYGDEFEKQLAALFLDGHRVAVFDNIETREGRTFANPKLSSILTNPSTVRIRLLGTNKTVCGTNPIFAATANDTVIGHDLVPRVLGVRLYNEDPCDLSPWPPDYAKEHRRELYEELLGLALRPPVHANDPRLQDPQYRAARRGFRFPTFLRFVEPRVGPLVFSAGVELDALAQDILQFLTVHPRFADGKEFSASDLERAFGLGELGFQAYGHLSEFLSKAKSIQAKAKRLGTELRRLRDKDLQLGPASTVHRLEVRTDRGHTTFRLRKVREESALPMSA